MIHFNNNRNNIFRSSLFQAYISVSVEHPFWKKINKKMPHQEEIPVLRVLLSIFTLGGSDLVACVADFWKRTKHPEKYAADKHAKRLKKVQKFQAQHPEEYMQQRAYVEWLSGAVGDMMSTKEFYYVKEQKSAPHYCGLNWNCACETTKYIPIRVVYYNGSIQHLTEMDFLTCCGTRYKDKDFKPRTIKDESNHFEMVLYAEMLYTIYKRRQSSSSA